MKIGGKTDVSVLLRIMSLYCIWQFKDYICASLCKRQRREQTAIIYSSFNTFFFKQSKDNTWKICVYVCLSTVRTHCGFLPLAEHTSSYQPPAPPDHLIRRPLHKVTCETHFYRLLNYAIFVATNLIILYRPSLEYLERLPELSEWRVLDCLDSPFRLDSWSPCFNTVTYIYHPDVFLLL